MDKRNAIGEFIRQQRQAAEVSVRELARLAGVSNPYLSQVERGLRKPSAEMLKQIARGLSVSAETLYARAGLLEPIPAGSVVDAIAEDSELSADQKSALVETYQAFLSANKSEGVKND